MVEIVSHESLGRDRGEKFYEYEQAGIAKYWLADDIMLEVAGREYADFIISRLRRRGFLK